LSTYRLSAPYEQSSPRRRAIGLALALAVNVALLLALLTLGIIPTPGKKDSTALVVDLVAEGERSPAPAHQAEPKRQDQPVQHAAPQRPTPKLPPIVLPVKPTIAAPPPAPWLIELSSADMAAGDIANAPRAQSGSAGDSEAVGRAPNGELLYAAEWAREPTNAELGGYLPRNAPDGFGLIACKTIANNRVDDCIEIANDPPGSHLASAVRQAAWQFRVRPPRKNGRPLLGSWVRIRIDYERTAQD
jgi:protein TonB